MELKKQTNKQKTPKVETDCNAGREITISCFLELKGGENTDSLTGQSVQWTKLNQFPTSLHLSQKRLSVQESFHDTSLFLVSSSI